MSYIPWNGMGGTYEMGYPITMGGGFIIGMSLPAFDTLILGYKSWICLFFLYTDFLLWEK